MISEVAFRLDDGIDSRVHCRQQFSIHPEFIKRLNIGFLRGPRRTQ